MNICFKIKIKYAYIYYLYWQILWCLNPTKQGLRATLIFFLFFSSIIHFLFHIWINFLFDFIIIYYSIWFSRFSICSVKISTSTFINFQLFYNGWHFFMYWAYIYNYTMQCAVVILIWKYSLVNLYKVNWYCNVWYLSVLLKLIDIVSRLRYILDALICEFLFKNPL